MEVLLNDLSAECSLAERGVAADAVDWRLLWLMGGGRGRGGRGRRWSADGRVAGPQHSLPARTLPHDARY